MECGGQFGPPTWGVYLLGGTLFVNGWALPAATGCGGTGRKEGRLLGVLERDNQVQVRVALALDDYDDDDHRADEGPFGELLKRIQRAGTSNSFKICGLARQWFESGRRVSSSVWLGLLNLMLPASNKLNQGQRIVLPLAAARRNCGPCNSLLPVPLNPAREPQVAGGGGGGCC